MRSILPLLYQNLHVDSQPFYNLIKDSTPFHWAHEHENYFNQSKTELAKTRSLLCPQPTIPSTFTWTRRMLDLAVFSSNSFLRENKYYPSTPEFSTKPNIVIYIVITYIVITNRSFTYGDAKDNYHIGSSVMK